MAKKFGYPQVGRFGLGHSLLAWARCVVWCQANNAEMIAPRWLQPRLGPYLRRERDKREYFKLFAHTGCIGEPRRSWLLLTSVKTTYSISDPAARESTVVVFRNAVGGNFEKYFHEVQGHGARVHAALRAITRSRYLPPPPARPFVAVHVRLGDFASFDSSAALVGRHNLRLPIEWYREAIEALRDATGKDLPVVVFSDGSDREIAPLLGLPQVRRAPAAVSVTHLLDMSQASAIISSGSGFSLWPAFFGQMPRITYPGQAIVRVNDSSDMEQGWDVGASISDEIADEVTRRFDVSRMRE